MKKCSFEKTQIASQRGNLLFESSIQGQRSNHQKFKQHLPLNMIYRANSHDTWTKLASTKNFWHMRYLTLFDLVFDPTGSRTRNSNLRSYIQMPMAFWRHCGGSVADRPAFSDCIVKGEPPFRTMNSRQEVQLSDIRKKSKVSSQLSGTELKRMLLVYCLMLQHFTNWHSTSWHYIYTSRDLPHFSISPHSITTHEITCHDILPCDILPPKI
jgi:hypothetical protein